MLSASAGGDTWRRNGAVDYTDLAIGARSNNLHDFAVCSVCNLTTPAHPPMRWPSEIIPRQGPILTTEHRQLDVLFLSESPLWPLDQGFRIRGYNMALTLSAMGIRVGVASHEPLPPDAPADLVNMAMPWPTVTAKDYQSFLTGWSGPLAPLRRRLARYQGRDMERFAGIVPLTERHHPAVVIGLGQHAPLMLRGLHGRCGIKRIWYAADELVQYQLSCLRRDKLAKIPHRLQLLALYATLETLFVRGLDGAIGVSPRDTAMLGSIAGARHATTIRNGVDTAYFSPDANTRVKPRSLVFWGRMDFEPNIDAVCWFAKVVWPAVKVLYPSATWQIIGKNPHPRVIGLAQVPGVAVLGEVPDIRPHARSASITILPMRCGAGIKNKLLEAAAMGRPVVASGQAIAGLEFDGPDRPLAVCHGGDEWLEMICRLWSDTATLNKLGANAHQWVLRHHSWPSSARQLVAWLESLPGDARASIAKRQAQRHPPQTPSSAAEEQPQDPFETPREKQAA